MTGGVGSEIWTCGVVDESAVGSVGVEVAGAGGGVCSRLARGRRHAGERNIAPESARLRAETQRARARAFCFSFSFFSIALIALPTSWTCDESMANKIKNHQLSWWFDGEPLKAVLKDSATFGMGLWDH
jgi:hypothetical protein